MAWTETTRLHYRREASRHASDLTNAEWALIAPFLPTAGKLGRPRKTDLRETLGREASPTAGVIDRQPVKTTECGGPRGIDAGKKIKGRKRHIVTDTEGCLVGVRVRPADI